MAQSIMVFDFGTNEEAAQQARHKVEGWKQAFRLGNKMSLKFEREEPAEKAAEPKEPEAEAPAKKKSGAKKAAAKSSAKAAKEEKDEGKEPPARVRLLIRLAFSDHEKLTYQRWLDRIPAEEPFKSAEGETIRAGDAEFSKTAEQFDQLD